MTMTRCPSSFAALARLVTLVARHRSTAVKAGRKPAKAGA